MIRSIVDEIIGLFVDDGSLALGLVVWTVIVGVLRTVLPDSAALLALLLAIGYVAVLLVSVVRSARRSIAASPPKP